MSDVDAVARLYNDMNGALQVLLDAKEVSAHVTLQDHARKALVLAAASHFEHQVCGHLRNLAASASNPLLVEFVANKAIARQYHTLFQWDTSSASSFFGLFGTAFKVHMKERLRSDVPLDSSIKAFLEIGSLRNQLVHQDYATFALEKTAEEIFELYRRAAAFVEALPSLLANASS